jgi:hypothetical protein
LGRFDGCRRSAGTVTPDGNPTRQLVQRSIAVINRPAHDPTEESNEQVYIFLDHALKFG